VRQVRLVELLSGVIYKDFYGAEQVHEKLAVPSSVRKDVKTLYYLLGVSPEERKCIFDDDCNQPCAWNGICEPQAYGHHGLVLPSATLFMDWKSIFELGHWPVVGWKFNAFCPDCLKNLPVIVFNSQYFLRSVFENTGSDGASERYPDLEFYVWKRTKYVRRVEGCAGITVGSRGKDCSIPMEYVFVGQGMYVSSPYSSEDIPVASEIHVEKVTGLRFDFLDTWQVNHHVKIQEKDVFVPVFWVQRRPALLKLDDSLQFSKLKSYGGDVMELCLIAWIIYVIFNIATIVGFFYGISCVDYCADAKARYAPFVPQYI
jgi:hypothetical protein